MDANGPHEASFVPYVLFVPSWCHHPGYLPWPTNVARANLEELLRDYLDFLRVRDLRIWDKRSREARYVRGRSKELPATFESWREFVETRPAEIVANIAICLIHQTNYLLDQQINRLQTDFLHEGGLRERMTRARMQARSNRPRSDN